LKSVLTKQRIIQAARECFDRYGARKVSLEDVSQHAGVHRQTIYRLFKDREALRWDVMLLCTEELAKVARDAVEKGKNLRESIVLGAIATVAHARQDRTLGDLLHADWRLALEQLGEDTMVSQYFALAWKPAFDRAKAAGEVSPDWEFADFSLWFRGVLYILFLREDLSGDAMLKLLNQFVSPGLLH
jgi:AcrR family transcriptional regulator